MIKSAGSSTAIMLTCLFMSQAQVWSQEQGQSPGNPLRKEEPPTVGQSATDEDQSTDADQAAETNNAATSDDQIPAGEQQLTGAAAKWATTYGQWKDLIREMRQLRDGYTDAEDSEKNQRQGQWDEMLTRGNAMIGELTQAGIAAYRESPNSDRQLARELVKILTDLVARDDYEPAFELGKLLIDNDSGFSVTYDLAGSAAFCLNDYELSEKYLDEASLRNVLSDKGTKFRGLIEKYKAIWAEEEVLRKAEADANDLPRVKLTTNKGEVLIELFENEAPDTVGNFISLVEKEFYNGLTFHRVLEGFMAQGGDPAGDGSGGPGYSIYCECTKPEHRKHFRGSLSMAKETAPNTGGSQFFLTFVPTDHLNGMHTVFGRVIKGMDVLAKLRRRDPTAADAPEADKIIAAEVLRKRDHEYKPNKVE